MRRLFFVLTVCILFCVSAPLSAQEQGEPHFGAAVELLSVETVILPASDEDVLLYDGLVLSRHIIRDDENRSVRTDDGAVYPWPDSFAIVTLAYDNSTGNTLIYNNNVFLWSTDSAYQATTYWTLNLETGVYTQRETDTVATFCGNIPPRQLTSRWVFEIEGDEARLCSLSRQIVSDPLPADYAWFYYESNPIVLTESPSGDTVVFVGIANIPSVFPVVYFRYDTPANTVTKLGVGSIYLDSNIRAEWLSEEILSIYSTNHGANTFYDPILNVIDLRFDDVLVIKGFSRYTQENQIIVDKDALQITVKDIAYMDLYADDLAITHTYCRDTIYNLLNRTQRQIDYGEFCHLVGGERYGLGYYLLNRHLWRYNLNYGDRGIQAVDQSVNHVQLWDKTLLIYTDTQVLQLDTTVDDAVPEVFFDHPALELVADASVITTTNPFHYFITTDGLLRVNVETDEQDLLFKGAVSLVTWINAERGIAELIYQQIVDNFPPYIPPTIHDVDPYVQPAYSAGKLALVSLNTGAVIFETDTSWNKLREWFDGSWDVANIREWGNGWFNPERSNTVYILSPEGEQVDPVDVGEERAPVLRAEDWLLVQDYNALTLSLLNPATNETIFVADGAYVPLDIHYEGNGEFSWNPLGDKIYHFRVSQIVS